MAARVVRRCIHVVVVVVMLCPSPFVSAGRAVNVATRSTCSASCRPDGDQCTDCRLAINGLRYSGDWRYTGPTAGGWLRIVFDQTYDVSWVYLVLPFYQENRQFKDIKLTFSDGSEHTVTLGEQSDGWVEENVTIVPSRLSSSVNLTVVSAFDDSEHTNIVSEVEVYTTSPDYASTTPPSTSTTPPTTSTTPPSTSTTPPTTLTTPPTTSTTPPNTTDALTNVTDSPVSVAVTTRETNVTADSDPAHTKPLWTGSSLYIIVGVVAALLILVICSTVSRKDKQSKDGDDVFDMMS